MIGIGTDNASVMVGVNNGLVEILKKEHGLKHLILIRCVCHSLQLAVSHASVNTLPRNIEFLVRETYNWFSISPKRQEEYKKVYETINYGKQPLKILKVCATRWLSIEPAVCRILEQWEELKLHFSFAMGNDNCYTADLSYRMYCDDSNQLYMLYLKQTLKDVQIALKAFEGEDNDPTKLLDTLVFLMQSLGKNIVFPTFDLLTTPVPNECMYANPHLGYTFEQKMLESSLSQENKSYLKKRCIDFSLKLIKQIQQRLPSNVTILKKMSMLNVEETLKVNKTNALADVAKELGFSNEFIDGMLQEWHNINFIKWNNTTNTVRFWIKVLQYKNAVGENPFSLISQLAITILILPHSNAEVERVFSSMNIIKTKQRNRLSLKTINALILLRDQLKKQNKNCASFEIPSEVLQLIGTNKSYSFATTKNVELQHPLLSDVQPSTSAAAVLDEHETEELFDLLSDDDEYN
ncbi:unnamed protein product [Parnassius mnemosyne]|uniref:HAT C-terminal dimerisation domain-containing protein n=1 Tax=Parnassius mnemosyne TaxID=213953 RepID=A0AAV1KR69_9NEOP